jgi:hypothetical protein
MTRLTKVELLQKNQLLSAENYDLRKQLFEATGLLEALRASNQMPQDKYPLVDGRGRHYRLEGRIRCYPAN